MRLVDSECARGSAASDGAALVAKFNRAHGKHAAYGLCGPATAHRRRGGARSEAEDFIVHHFAGQYGSLAPGWFSRARPSVWRRMLSTDPWGDVAALLRGRELAVRVGRAAV